MKNRNKNSIYRRSFLKSLVTIPCFIGSNAAVSGILGSGEGKPPFEILAIGDSVVWGQGLSEEFKFTVLTKEWLWKEKFAKRRNVNLHYLEAHSGATIFPDERLESIPRKYNGEINVSLPSILQQVNNAATFYMSRKDLGGPLATGNVDLIILDGGINDVEAASIIFKEPEEISGLAHKFCYEGMRKKLLPEVARVFPNANVIVTGYFMLISDNSCESKITETVLEVLKLGKLADFASWLSRFRKDKSEFMNEMSRRSKTWYEESNDALEKAVTDANKDKSLPGSRKFSELNPRFSFVLPDFKPENAYGASRSWLWELVEGKPVDPMATIRKEVCKEVKWPKDFVCRRASTFHPNIAGSQEYAKAIIARLETLIPHAKWTS